MIKKLTYENVKPYIEALKELARVALLACIPILIDGITQNKINWTLVASAAMISALRGLDKLLHLEGKEKGNDTLTGGLTRF
jgi:hypothetical protein